MVQVVVFSLTNTQSIYSGELSYTLILKSLSDNRILPMVIGVLEAEAIVVELNGTKTKNPLSHDMFKSALSIMEASIVKVVVTSLKQDTYYAMIAINYKGKTYDIDSRPSDAIALALRFNAPIFVSDEVMDTSSYPLEGLDDSKEENLYPKSQLDILKEKLEKALKDELYEEAASLRDEISKIEKTEKNK